MPKSATTIYFPKVSVALPVYNTKEEYLRECIESILEQTFTNFECIIINDASTESHVERTILSYNDPRIRYYCNEKNMGISNVRNSLIEHSTGEYIAVTDHDDISVLDRFEKQVTFLDAYPDIGVVSGLLDFFPKKEEILYPEYTFDIKTQLFFGCILPHPACMLRRSVLIQNNIRYEEQYSPAEDYMLWCRLMRYTQFYNIQEVLLRYRWHTTNTSIIQSEKMKTATTIIQKIMQEENHLFYATALQCFPKSKYIRLFGIIPFLKIKQKGRYTYWYLFHYILLFKLKV